MIATAYFKNYAVAIATGISTLVVLTFGEIIPKSFAKMNAESISMAFARGAAYPYGHLYPVQLFVPAAHAAL